MTREIVRACCTSIEHQLSSCRIERGKLGLVAGDFNGDGKLDLAEVDGGDSNGNGVGVSVRLGNGDGIRIRLRWI